MNNPQDLIAQVMREYAEKTLVETANKKIEDIDKYKKTNDYDERWDWLSHMCYGIKEDYENKKREFWK